MNFFDFLDTVNDVVTEINKETAKNRAAELKASRREAEVRAREAEVRARQAELDAEQARREVNRFAAAYNLRPLSSPTLPVGTAVTLLTATWSSADRLEILKRIGAQVHEKDFLEVLGLFMVGERRMDAVRALAHGGALRRAALAAACGEAFYSGSARREAILIALG